MSKIYPELDPPVSSETTVRFGDDSRPVSGGTFVFETENGRKILYRSTFIDRRLDIGRTTVNLINARLEDAETRLDDFDKFYGINTKEVVHE